MSDKKPTPNVVEQEKGKERHPVNPFMRLVTRTNRLKMTHV